MNSAGKNILPYLEFNEESEFHSGFAQTRDFDDFPDLFSPQNPQIPKNDLILSRFSLSLVCLADVVFRFCMYLKNV